MTGVPDAKAENLLRVQFHNGDRFYYDFERCECETNWTTRQCNCLTEALQLLATVPCVEKVGRVLQRDFQFVDCVYHPADLNDHLAYYAETYMADMFAKDETGSGGSMIFSMQEVC